MRRQCGDCQLCCKLLPVKDNEPWRGAPAMDKPAGQKCIYQKHHVGCTVYGTGKMPACCQMWNCRWVVDTVPRDIGRPDRVHYVIDIMPDFVTTVSNGVAQNVQVVQIWVDPRYPDAHRDPALRAWLAKLAEEQHILGMVRYSHRDTMMLLAPSVTEDGEWWEHRQNIVMREHTNTLTEVVSALGGQAKVIFEE